MKLKGEIHVKVDTPDGQQLQLPLVVVKGKGASLLGRDWLRWMRLDWQTMHEIRTQTSKAELQQLLNKHREAFSEGLGEMK